jgi:hypothetical protein
MKKKNNSTFKVGDKVRIRLSYRFDDNDGEEIDLEGYVGTITRIRPHNRIELVRYDIDNLVNDYDDGPTFYSEYIEHVRKPKLKLPDWF